MSVTILKENGKLSIRYILDSNHFLGFAENPEEFLVNHNGVHEIVEDRENSICWFLIKDGKFQYKLNKINPFEQLETINTTIPQQINLPNISSQIESWMRSNAFERSSNFSSFFQYTHLNGQIEPVRIYTYLDCFGMTRIQVIDQYGNFL